MEGTDILKLNNITKTYSGQTGKRLVFSKFTMSVKNGELLSIVGPSGCGKSTLLNMIAQLESWDSGELVFHKNGSNNSSRGEGQILIFQELALFPWLNVEENIGFGLKMRGVDKELLQKKVNVFLEMMKLLPFRNSFLHELSGGMKQKVALARSLILNPRILLMDEPFAALDAQTRDYLHGELQRIWTLTQKTIIFVTHNVREAVCLGDRVLVLSPNTPTHINGEFIVGIPRPRSIESPGVIEIVRKVLSCLKQNDL